MQWISKGKYYFYHPNEQKVFVARSARFLEIDFALDGTCVHKVELKEESREPHEPEVESDLVDDPVPLPHSPNLHIGLKRPVEHLIDIWAYTKFFS